MASGASTARTITWKTLNSAQGRLRKRALLFRVVSAPPRHGQRLGAVAQVAAARLEEVLERVANVAREQAIEERVGSGIGVRQPQTERSHLSRITMRRFSRRTANRVIVASALTTIATALPL